MLAFNFGRRLRWTWGWALVLVVAAGAGFDPPALAESARDPTALKFVPEDAAFFWSFLRVRQQIDAFKNSKALARLMESPVFKKAKAQANELPAQAGAPDLDTVKGMLEAPEFKELADLVADAFSHEIFVFGDAGYADLIETFTATTREMEAIQLEAAKAGRDTDDETVQRKITDLALRQIQKVRIPKTIIGFKLSDPKPAQAQLAQLEAMLAAMSDMQPGWQGRFKREMIGTSQILTLQLDGSLIPWDQIQPPAAANQERYDKIVEAMKKVPLVVSIGVRGNYLLISLGDTNDHLKTLGTGKLLADRPELAPLAKHADKQFTSISYTSQALREKNSGASGPLDAFTRGFEQGFAMAGVDENLASEIKADLKALSADMKRYIPKAGAQTSFAFLTPRGREGFSYDWTQDLVRDATQKLTILDHVGGNPVAFAAGRKKYAPQDFDLTVKWVQRGFYYFEQIGLDLLEPEQQEIYDKLRVELVPLAQRLEQVTRTKWIPAFQDGQSAFVLDAKLTSKQWHSSMPAATQPMPILELGLVYGVSDANLLREGASDYLQLTQSAIKRLHVILPDVVPDYDFPLPASRQFPEGTVYYYALPTDWGVDPQIAPNAALSDKTLALSLMPKTGLRLLKPTPLAVEGPVAAAKDRPLAAASYFNLAGLVDATAPWLDYSVDQAGAQGLISPAEYDLTAQETKDGTRALLNFVKCLRSMSSVTYAESGAVVTHSEWQVVDQ